VYNNSASLVKTVFVRPDYNATLKRYGWLLFAVNRYRKLLRAIKKQVWRNYTCPEKITGGTGSMKCKFMAILFLLSFFILSPKAFPA